MKANKGDINNKLKIENKYIALREEIWKLATQPIKNELSFFHEIFKRIGDSIEPSRISLNKFNEKNESYVVCEWLKPGISPSPDIQIPEELWKYFIHRKDFDFLSRDGLLELAEKDEALGNYIGFIQQGLEQADINNFIYFLYRINNSMEGYIVFDWCKQENEDREWNEYEVVTGVEMTKIIAATIENYRSKKRLIESEEHYRALLENADDYAIFRLIAGKSPLSSEIIMVSPSVLNFTGLNQDDCYKYLNWFDIIHSDDKERIMGAISQSYSRPYIFNEYYRIIHPDEGPKWLHVRSKGTENIYGELEYINGLITDVTNEKEIERSLIENEEKFRSLYEHTDDGLLILSSNRIIEANKAALDLFGYTEDELIGKHPSELSPKEQKNGEISMDMAEKYIRKALKETSVRFEWIHKRKDGTTFETEILLNTFEFSSLGTVQAVIRDISDRKQIEQKLISEKEEIQKSEQIKTDFLASMSHDFRTPLNSITGFADLLKNKDLSNDMRIKYIDQINFNSQLLLSLIEDYIDISKINSGKLKLNKSNFDLGKLIESIANQVSTTSDIPIETNIYGEKDELILYSDHNRLRQILLNICELNIQLSDTNKLNINAVKSPVFIDFVICNKPNTVTEACIAKLSEEQEKLINIQGKITQNLGFTISLSLIELFNGDLKVYEVEKGIYVFHASFPFEKPLKSIQVNKTSKKPELPNWKDKTLLIAEDEQANFMYLKEVLRKTNINVIWAKDGKKAIELYKENDVDLILMDIQLPKLDGYKATSLIKNIDPNVPIIAQTAFAMIEDSEKCFAAGCDEYLTKPIKASKLIAILKNYIQ